MPQLDLGTTSIHFEVRGEGFPLLLLAPGGMKSTISMWANATIDPWTAYAADFRLIAMDQRNAGSSSGPLDTGDPWGGYAADQLAVLDHLGVDRFLVMGCCIGGSFVLRLCRDAPDRVVGGVLEQPIGVQDDNRKLFIRMQQSWAEEQAAARPDLARADLDRFLASMWDGDFVVSVSSEDIERCQAPLLVLPGIDPYHPTEAGQRIAAMAPRADVVGEWKEPPDVAAKASARVREFLLGLAAASGG